MRIALALLLLWPLALFATDRDLTDCADNAPYTAVNPLDLDTCTIEDGDDITAILTDLDTAYGDVYVRAPSRAAWVESAYVAFTVDDFYFLEDGSPLNTLEIRQKGSPANASEFYTVWSIANFDNVVIGGPNLSMTFKGTHPGLGNCAIDQYPTFNANSNCDGAAGLLAFSVTDNSQPALADIRANFRFSQAYSIRFDGSQAYGNGINKIQQVNIAGLHYATSGPYVNGGVSNLWFDPDRTVMSDPYNRTHGWDGATAATVSGYAIGCFDADRDQSRSGGVNTIAVDHLTGGATFEYGTHVATQRTIGLIGSADEPFILRVKDWGASGPGTAYPAGVITRRSHQPILFKGDPAPDEGYAPSRFIHFVKLPDDYQSGHFGESLTSGCAVGNDTSNSGTSGYANMVRLEAGGSANFVNNGYQVTFSGDWTSYAQGGSFWRGQLFLFHYADGDELDSNRSWEHVLRLASGTTVADAIQMIDTNTVTGPGTFTNITVADLANSETGFQADNNLVTDTNIAGTITVSSNAGTLTVDNVNFTGAARAVITVATGSAAIVSDLCVPNGSTITGAGTLTYEGEAQTMPYTIADSTANCSITADPRPGPVTGGGVN